MDEPTWLTPAELGVWLSFMASSQHLMAALDKQLQRDVGIPHSWYGVLALLSNQPGRTVRQSLLAHGADFSLSRLSHAVAKMEERGWLSREPDPADARATLVTLTDDGMAALAGAAPGHAAEVRRLLLDKLTPEQAAALKDACRTILQGLGSIPSGLVPPPGLGPP